jgi:hypothetical protein
MQPSQTQIEQMKDEIRRGEVCAWPVEVALDALNVAYPDKNARYYVMPYILQPGQSLILSGAYPFARFSSLTTYFGLGMAGRGIELLDWLRDSEITPDAGSANAALDPGAPTDLAHRKWTVRLTGTAPVDGPGPYATHTGTENVLLAHPEGGTSQLGILVLRVYVPRDPADSTGGVGLPTITFEDAEGHRRPLEACPAEKKADWSDVIRQLVLINVAAAARLPLPPDAKTPPEWVESPVPGLAPNPDNRYLMAPVAWEPGRIVVIRAKASTFPNTRKGDPQTLPTQVRYWSFSTGSNIVDPPLGYPTTDSVSDFEIPIGRDGSYTIVASQPEDRPANATIENGVAWLKGADPSLPDLIVMRHMIPAKTFYDQSIWAVPELTPGAAAGIMGPYFPETVYSDKATFEAGGADACFEAAKLVGSRA